MLEFEDALARVMARALPLKPVACSPREARGLLLAEAITADLDSPPFDKSIVDGYAVVAEDLLAVPVRLRCLEEITAGEMPRETVAAGTATRIMTGAPIPTGADAVVMIERTRLLEPRDASDAPLVEIDEVIRSGQNILRRGQSMRAGEVVLKPGHRIRPAEVGLLCEVGRREILVTPRARVAVLPTGNEVIPHELLPTGGQIRNTNGPMLCAAVERCGAEPVDLGVARDEPAELRRLIRQGLECDMLLLSGGVSAGVLDLVPQALADEGVAEVFHKVRFKPGKPLWFGVAASVGKKSTLVFGLPGNPVSSLVCFELFVRPALDRLAGIEGAFRPRTNVKLAQAFRHRGNRPTWHPGVLRSVEGEQEATPLTWQGSADLRTLTGANALIRFPAGDREFVRGEAVEVWPMDS